MNRFKWYRWFKGGVWYKYYPDIHGCTHMRFWTQDKNSIVSHEIVIKTENYEK